MITTKVNAAVFNEPPLKSAGINVDRFKGVVQPSGFVSSQANIHKATEVARAVGGVESVKNDMRLKVMGGHRPNMQVSQVKCCPPLAVLECGPDREPIPVRSGCFTSL